MKIYHAWMLHLYLWLWLSPASGLHGHFPSFLCPEHPQPMSPSSLKLLLLPLGPTVCIWVTQLDKSNSKKGFVSVQFEGAVHSSREVKAVWVSVQGSDHLGSTRKQCMLGLSSLFSSQEFSAVLQTTAGTCRVHLLGDSRSCALTVDGWFHF